jgi:TIR domain
MGSLFDVFISYSHEDAVWVSALAGNLHRNRFEVFFDEWEIGPGDVLTHRLEAGIRTATNGVLVVSEASMARPWVQEEYAAMLTRAVDGQQRLVPVLLGEAELPPFLASRVWVDFREGAGPMYEQRFEELVRALRGERPGRPPRDGQVIPPPDPGASGASLGP